MSTFAGSNSNFTPSTSADNYTLDATNTAGSVGIVESIGFGGSLNTAGGYRTTWARPTTNGSSTFTSIVPQSGNPTQTPGLRLGTFATPATLAAEPGGLLTQAWNAFGGLGFITFPINGAWILVGVATAGYGQLSCRNRAGADASSSTYAVEWRE